MSVGWKSPSFRGLALETETLTCDVRIRGWQRADEMYPAPVEAEGFLSAAEAAHLIRLVRARWVTLRARWVTLKSSLGDAMSSLGDAKSSLGDAKSSLGDAMSWVTL